ncbi:hypothetical protein EYF80_057995 [Liparis tanakae]|uniref:Uncharacterized protein n=1 Tax=Liparis tanakae TaxID=230148 RepID=A0A4Z2ESF7_9TELE|nr:hypothetical protein EYF80_057995 [Liparis tanakae]
MLQRGVPGPLEVDQLGRLVHPDLRAGGALQRSQTHLPRCSAEVILYRWQKPVLDSLTAMKLMSSSLVWTNGERAAAAGEGRRAHVDPDVAGLLVDDEGLHAAPPQGLQAPEALGGVLAGGDEERRRQQDQLETLLPPVHHGRPGAEEEEETDSVSQHEGFRGAPFTNGALEEGTPYYRPSLVQPALVMYSAPGNRRLKGTGSSFSCAPTIWRADNRKLA